MPIRLALYIVVRVINPVLALHNIPFSEKLHFPYVTKSDFFITNPCVESVFVPVLLVLHLAIESLILILAAEHSPLRSSSPLEAVFNTERISSLAQSVLDLPKPGTEAARTLPEPSFSNKVLHFLRKGISWHTSHNPYGKVPRRRRKHTGGSNTTNTYLSQIS